VVQGHAKHAAKELANVSLGVDYRVSEGNIKLFLMNSVVKLAMFVKKL